MCFLHVQTRQIQCYMSKFAMGSENMIFITPLFCQRQGKYDFYTTPVSILGGIYYMLTSDLFSILYNMSIKTYTLT